MTEPIVEQLAVAIKTCIEGVAIPGTSPTTTLNVIRPTKAGQATDTFKNYDVILQQDDPSLPENESPQQFKAWLQPFLIDLILRPTENSTTPLDTLINRFRSDVEKALMADLTFGKLAVNGWLDPPVAFKSADGEYEGTRIVLNSLYRTLETDPYSQGA